jgi:GAF domain-containing protein
MVNLYRNATVGAVANPVITSPDAIDEAFAGAANAALHDAVDLVRVVAQCHQAAAAIVVEGDWSTVRKYFSLSEKYAEWSDYAAPATGYGTHGWLLRVPQVVRLTQTELEAHPEWKGFGHEAGRHPPMRGWMAAPITDRNGKVWGLMQASDRLTGDFSADDEAAFVSLCRLLSQCLEALWDTRNLQKAAQP